MKPVKEQQENRIEKNIKRKNFYMKPNIVIDFELEARMKPSESKVYDVLCRFAHPDSGLCYPSISTICRLSGYSKTPVCAATKQLVVYGLIEKKLALFKGNNNPLKKKVFRMTYRVLKEPIIELATIPWKLEQYKKPLQGKDGKFISPPTNLESHTLPTSSEGFTLPTNSEQKKTKEELKKLTLRENKSSYNISKETIKKLKEAKGEEWLKKYLLEYGYSLELLKED